MIRTIITVIGTLAILTLGFYMGRMTAATSPEPLPEQVSQYDEDIQGLFDKLLTKGK